MEKIFDKLMEVIKEENELVKKISSNTHYFYYINGRLSFAKDLLNEFFMKEE